MKQIIACWILLLALYFCVFDSRFSQTRMADLPPLFLWAWERPEDFSRCSLPPGVGIAYLAATIHVVGSKVLVSPRRQPLLVAPTVPLIAVCRIEVDEHKRTILDSKLAEKVCTTIAPFVNDPRASAVQIDFDALHDERSFYSTLLQRLRRALPGSKGLSVTALVSWCLCDTWMQSLPVDESVPMCFSMGREQHNILVDLKGGRPYGDPRCYSSLGISIDETGINSVVVPLAFARHADKQIRLYIFNSKSWSPAAIHKAVEIGHGRFTWAL